MPDCLGFLQHRHDGDGVVGSDGDQIRALGDELLNELDLLFDPVLRGAYPFDMDLGEFGTGFIDTTFNRIVIRDAGELGDDDDVQRGCLCGGQTTDER